MVTRITKQSPTGGAKLKRPDGSTYLELPKTPYDANKEGETRKTVSYTHLTLPTKNEV